MSHPVDWPIVGEVMQDGTSEEMVKRESYVKIESDYVKIETDDDKMETDDVKMETDDVKMEAGGKSNVTS